MQSENVYLRPDFDSYRLFMTLKNCFVLFCFVLIHSLFIYLNEENIYAFVFVGF